MAKRKKKKSKCQVKVARVMGEYHRGTLKSSSGAKVTNPEQAAAIGYSYPECSSSKRSKKRSKRSK